MDASTIIMQLGISALLIVAALLALRWILPVYAKHAEERALYLRNIALTLDELRQILERIEALYASGLFTQSERHGPRPRGRTPPPKEE